MCTSPKTVIIEGYGRRQKHRTAPRKPRRGFLHQGLPFRASARGNRAPHLEGDGREQDGVGEPHLHTQRIPSPHGCRRLLPFWADGFGPRSRVLGTRDRCCQGEPLESNGHSSHLLRGGGKLPKG